MEKKKFKPKDIDDLIDKLDMEPVLNSMVRRVRWLYSNSNRMTMVYDEKLVRLMVHRLKERIAELEQQSPITDKEFVKALLPGHYEVTRQERPLAIRCVSSTGINDLDEATWRKFKIEVIKWFGERFQEIYHNVCANHTDFNIYFKLL